MSESGSPPVPATVSTPVDLQVKTANVFERITPEELWACTSCRACDEICPVNIEIFLIRSTSIIYIISQDDFDQPKVC